MDSTTQKQTKMSTKGNNNNTLQHRHRQKIAKNKQQQKHCKTRVPWHHNFCAVMVMAEKEEEKRANRSKSNSD